MRAQHVRDCIWIFWPITLVMVLAMALIAFSLCWHPVTVYPSNAPTAQCHFGPIGCHPVAVPWRSIDL